MAQSGCIWLIVKVQVGQGVESLTGQFAGRWRQAAAIQSSPHQHKAHLFGGALEHLHIAVLHHLLVAFLRHHERTVGRLHLNEGITGRTTLEDERKKRSEVMGFVE